MIGFLMMCGLFTIAVLPELVFAQELTGKGVRVGLNRASVSGLKGERAEIRRYNEGNSKFGFSVGGFLTYGLNEKFAIQPEIIYSIKIGEYYETYSGDDYDGEWKSEQTETYKLSSIDIPILFVFSVTENVELLVGPFASIIVDGRVEVEYASSYYDYQERYKVDLWEYTKSPEFGLVFGGAYSHGQFSVGARYSMGLTSVVNNYDDEVSDRLDIKVQAIQLLGGYSF